MKSASAKYAILGDTHFIPKDSEIYVNYLNRFFSECFFPFLEKNKISIIIQVGDLFDTRKGTNHYSLYHAKKIFFDKLKQKSIHLITLLGNHDIMYKNSLEINSPELLLKEYDNITIINKPTSLYGMSFIPWICQENYDNVMEYISNDTNKICFGHLELANFSMYKGFESKHGMSPTIFKGYDKVITGHYHTISSKNNILYVGTPYEMCWHDANDIRGFHVLDKNLKFIQNPFTLFNKIYYDDSKDFNYLDDDYVNSLQHKYIKIIVESKIPEKYDLFLEKLNTIDTLGLTINDKEQELLELQEDIDESDDTVSILNRYIDTTITDDLDVCKIKTIMFDIYNSALRIE